MTIASTVTDQQYTCNGATTQFSWPNKIFANTDLVVTLYDLSGNAYAFTNFFNALTGLSYTVQNVDVDSGCLVIFSSAPTFGWTLDIRSATPQQQSTSIKNQGVFFPESLEEGLDRLTRVTQDLTRLTYTYGIHGPDSETTPWPALPGPSVRKGYGLVFDAATGLPEIGFLTAQIVTQGLMAPLLNPQTPAEIAQTVTPTNYVYGSYDVRREGADQTGATDSTSAFQKAASLAKSGFYPIAVRSDAVGGVFTINGNIPLSYTGLGTVSGKGYVMAGPGQISPTGTGNVFSVTLDAEGQQNDRFVYRDLILQYNGSAIPTFFASTYADFVSLEDIVALGNPGTMLNWTQGGMMRGTNLFWFGGTGTAFAANHTRDSYLIGCQAYGGSAASLIGYSISGQNNVGSDGNFVISNCVANSLWQYGISLTGVYTPNINNCAVEQCGAATSGGTIYANIYVNSCNFGNLSNCFIGPTPSGVAYGVQFDYQSGITNDNWTISGLSMQGEMRLSHLNFSAVYGIVMQGVPVAPDGNASDIYLLGAGYNVFSGIAAHNSSNTYNWRSDSTGGFNCISGGRYEQGIRLDGTIGTRTGNNVIDPSYAGTVSTADGAVPLFLPSEYVHYFDGTRTWETSVGTPGGGTNFLLPFTVANGSIGASSNATINVNTLVPAGATQALVPNGAAQANGYDAEFFITGGLTGSAASAIVRAVSSLNACSLAIVVNNPNAGSLSVSVAGSTITVTNNNSGASMPYKVLMTKRVSY